MNADAQSTATVGQAAVLSPEPPLAAGAPASAPNPVEGRPPGRLLVLDLLRFGAALAVVAYHYLGDAAWRGASGVVPHFGVAGYAGRYGWLGVQCFFVISGFVICMSCWGRSVGDFFVSRATRLMPAYLFAVLFSSVLLMLWPLSEGRPPLSHVLVNLTMLQEVTPYKDIDVVYWTLFTELRFYLVFAIVVYQGLTYRRVVVFCVGWTILYLLDGIAHWPLLDVAVQRSFAPYFIAGITLYLIYRFGSNLLLWWLLGVCMVMAVPQLEAQVAIANKPTHVISPKVAQLLMLGFFALMILGALGKFSWVKWRGCAVLGALTYPIYLLHRPLGSIVFTHLYARIPVVVLIAVMVSAVLLLAHLVHRFVERPVAGVLRQRLRDSLASMRAADEQTAA